ncbi:MAG: hypothetical protein K2F91_07225, partial [Muribaculaceae bacterium]|nr:hypothetical protein [Muribaculaceae bacterium]
FRPFVPEALAGERTLDNFRYRNANLSITVRGFGSEIKSFTLNGKEHKPFIPATIKGDNRIVITMDDRKPAPMKVNHTANVKAPLTPITWIADGRLNWNPIEYIGHYTVLRDGVPVAKTRETSFDVSVPGEYQVIGVSTDGVESFASEPRSTRPVIAVQMPGEVTELSSPEISYRPSEAVKGYTGSGFIELDRCSKPLEVTVDVPEAGNYAIALRYANGNGPVNTENKCAIRTLVVNGKRAGITVMPHRGVANWYDWGISNYVHAQLKAGRNVIAIELRPENTNMNMDTNHAAIDMIVMEKLD